MSEALDVAARALKAAAGDEAEAVVQSERSGLARFAGSVQHQPTLTENTVVTLRVVRDGRVGVAVSNRIGDDGLRQLAARAGEAASSVRAEEDFPGLAPPAEYPGVGGYDEETASLGPEDQARLAAAAIARDRRHACLRLLHQRRHRARRRVDDGHRSVTAHDRCDVARPRVRRRHVGLCDADLIRRRRARSACVRRRGCGEGCADT